MLYRFARFLNPQYADVLGNEPRGQYESALNHLQKGKQKK